MKKVTGIGGVFFKSENADALNNWYRDHLGFKTTEWGATFIWNDVDPTITAQGRTVWSVFKDDTKYLDPSSEPFMINYRVHDLHRLMDTLKSGGVNAIGTIEEVEYGKFGWIMDLDGRKLELWEPIDGEFGAPPEVWTGPVTGLGGVFFKSNDPQATKDWYKKHLDVGDYFFWKDISNPAGEAMTVWSPLEPGSKFFEGSDMPYMFNYRVKDLVGVLAKLKTEGVKTSGGFETYPHGKFAWAYDPDGNKMALWEPN